jgi:hypothetical protein
MDDPQREAYERWIDRLRKIAATGMMCCFVGSILIPETPLTPVLLFGAAACFVLAIALFFEYLIRVLLFRPGRKLPWYQFSLAGMLILTACAAGVCA